MEPTPDSLELRIKNTFIDVPLESDSDFFDAIPVVRYCSAPVSLGSEYHRAEPEDLMGGNLSRRMDSIGPLPSRAWERMPALAENTNESMQDSLGIFEDDNLDLEPFGSGTCHLFSPSLARHERPDSAGNHVKADISPSACAGQKNGLQVHRMYKIGALPQMAGERSPMLADVDLESFQDFERELVDDNYDLQPFFYNRCHSSSLLRTHQDRPDTASVHSNANFNPSAFEGQKRELQTDMMYNIAYPREAPDRMSPLADAELESLNHYSNDFEDVNFDLQPFYYERCVSSPPALAQHGRHDSADEHLYAASSPSKVTHSSRQRGVAMTPKRATQSSTTSTRLVTTLMLCNLPCKLSQEGLVQAVDQLGFAGTYDLVYVPRGSNSHIGYGFINFRTSEAASNFTHVITSMTFSTAKTSRPVRVMPAKVQGFVKTLASIKKGENFRKRSHAPLIFSLQA